MKPTTGAVVVIVALVAIMLVVSVIRMHANTSSATEYVAPNGSDTASGLSQQTPFKTIQHALDLAKAGMTISLAPGSYNETITTKVSGTKQHPITIKGSDNAKAPSLRHKTVLYGSDRIVNVNNNYYVFEGFSIDGQKALINDPYPTDPSLMNAYKDSHQTQIKDGRLLYVGSGTQTKNVTGTRIDNMFLQGAGGECVRLRNDSMDTTITNSVIQYCGLHAKSDGPSDRYLYHNGEGIYIGTSPKSVDQPASDNDTSSYTTITNNSINTYGSECVDIKENSHDNVVQNNTCTTNLEPLAYGGSNLEIRGDHNTIEGNTIRVSQGWNLKLASDATKYDKGGNVVKDNKFSSAAGGTNLYIKQNVSKLVFCGNTLDGTAVGISSKSAEQSCRS